MHTAKEIKEIKDWWPLEPIVDISRFRKGDINISHHVTTAESDYVLRLYNRENLSEIDFEIELLTFLKRLPIPELIKFNGKFTDYCLGRPAVIYKYLSGDHLQEYQEGNLREVGLFLARFHNQSVGFQFEGARQQYYNFSEEKIKEYLKKIESSSVLHQDRLKGILRDLRSNMPSDELPRGPIHIDVKPDNILFEQGKLSGVLDFDNAYIGPLVLDLAKTMLWFGIGQGEYNDRQAKIIYHAYCQERSLSKSEEKILPKIIKYAFASHLFVDFYMLVIDRIPREYFDYLMKDFYASYQAYLKQS